MYNNYNYNEFLNPAKERQTVASIANLLIQLRANCVTFPNELGMGIISNVPGQNFILTHMRSLVNKLQNQELKIKITKLINEFQVTLGYCDYANSENRSIIINSISETLINSLNN